MELLGMQLGVLFYVVIALFVVNLGIWSFFYFRRVGKKRHTRQVQKKVQEELSHRPHLKTREMTFVRATLDGVSDDTYYYESFNVVLPKPDIERMMLIGVEHHLQDVVEQTQKTLHSRQVMRLVISGYEDVGQVWEVPNVIKFCISLHQRVPHIVFWLDPESLALYLRIVQCGLDWIAKSRAKAGTGPAPELRTPFNERLRALADSVIEKGNAVVFKIFENDHETAIKVMEEATARVEDALLLQDEIATKAQAAAAPSPGAFTHEEIQKRLHRDTSAGHTADGKTEPTSS
ncbi:MAG: hypothetical protein V2A74_07555 [bacterium]